MFGWIDGKFHRQFLAHGIGGHDGFSRVRAAFLGEACGQDRDPFGNGINGQGLADDAGGSDDYVSRIDLQGLRRQLAHAVGLLHPVLVAGIGVTGVADDRLSPALANVSLGNQDGCALDQILRIYRAGPAGLLAVDHGQVFFLFVLAYPAVGSRRGKPGRCGDAAGDQGVSHW